MKRAWGGLVPGLWIVHYTQFSTKQVPGLVPCRIVNACYTIWVDNI